uniref:Mrr-like domain-containing protein n=1 Tax=viral metagenome TaxID=1070528 RepID=A0A6C0DB46_9ZZZZ
MIELNKLLYTIYLKSPVNLFTEFLVECQKSYAKPAHTLLELKQRNNNKIKGDIFEEFCVLYLLNIKKYDKVWLLKDTPEDILTKLNLKRRDMGIDIIVENKEFYYAVQCKYKKHNTMKKNVLSWKVLSTFYALCLKAGPFEKYIVMTNCDYVRHAVTKNEKDISICLKSFENITKDEWLTMCDVTGKTISQNISSMCDENIPSMCDIVENTISQPDDIVKDTKLTLENLRNKRLAFYDKKI